jgi:hypothetical protein
MKKGVDGRDKPGHDDMLILLKRNKLERDEIPKTKKARSHDRAFPY